MSRRSLSIGLVALAAVALAMVPNLLRSRVPQDGFVTLREPALPMEAPSRLDKTAASDSVAQGVVHRASALSAPATPAAGQASLEAMVASRKLIRTAQLALEVKSYEDAAGALAQIAESNGGYLADAQAARGGGDHRRGTLTIRVPAERFGAAYAALKGLGKVETETVATQDVTKAYADLETRLRVKRDAEARLREILRTRTARLSDVLEAERELTRVTEEIEQAEGERRFYDQQVALSTLTAVLHEPEAVIRPGALAPLAEAFRGSVRLLAESAAALLYVVVLVVPWAAAGTLVWLSVRALRRRASA